MGAQIFSANGTDETPMRPSGEALTLIATLKSQVHIVKLVDILDDYHTNY